MHEAMDLAAELRLHLGAGSAVMWGGTKQSVMVRGRVGLSHDDVVTSETAEVVIEVPSRWRDVPPTVRSFEYWIKRGIDWHTFSIIDGLLCYVFNGHWRHHIQALGGRNLDKPVEHYAAKWCVNSVAWLLYRHLYAHEHKLPKWNPAWGGWPHSPADAWHEFNRLKLKGSI